MRYIIYLAIAVGFLMPNVAESAGCSGTFLNPVSDVCWDCMFPVRVGSIMSFGGGGGGEAPGSAATAVCACPTSGGGIRVGLNMGFWEHARLIEVVKDPYCFPVLGSGLANPAPGYNAGSSKAAATDDSNSDHSFKQVHYYVFPAWSLLNLFMDFPCAENDVPFDLAYISELDPLWPDDLLTFILNPEALAFGNPISQLACPVDTVAATLGKPIEALFWCAGSWGSMYPMSGNAGDNNFLNAAGLLATRFLYKAGREGFLLDTGINSCAYKGVYSPIMRKANYRFQIARPAVGTMCVPIGRPSMIWGSGKNPAWGTGKGSPDNFLFVETRARVCCAGYEIGAN